MPSSDSTSRQTGLQMIWVWVKIKPPGYGPQVLVHVSIYQGNLFFWYFFLTHSHFVSPPRCGSLLLQGAGRFAGSEKGRSEYPLDALNRLPGGCLDIASSPDIRSGRRLSVSFFFFAKTLSLCNEPATPGALPQAQRRAMVAAFYLTHHSGMGCSFVLEAPRVGLCRTCSSLACCMACLKQQSPRPTSTGHRGFCLVVGLGWRLSAQAFSQLRQRG